MVGMLGFSLTGRSSPGKKIPCELQTLPEPGSKEIMNRFSSFGRHGKINFTAQCCCLHNDSVALCTKAQM